jgi:ribonucleoside-diphosphate reductase alpha chain
MYYLRTKAAVDALSGLGIDTSKYKTIKEETPTVETKKEVPAQQFKINEDLKALAEQTMNNLSCSLDNPDACEACGS